MRCSACQNEPPADSSFCNRCGSALSGPPAYGERRQLTVMFCDIVGSTELAHRIDGEELRLVVGEYQNSCARIIRDFDGYVAQYLGDGLLVYFGYPRAHEDDAVRAVTSALRILDELPALNAFIARRLPALADQGLEVRMGLHSGPAVLSDMGLGDEQQRLALGETPNVAARLQAMAEAGSILISEATARLVRGAFVLDDLGPLRLKGLSAPVGALRVVAASGAESRLERLAPAGLTPLVGREQEIALVVERWQRARAGEGQTVLLSGEPGIGKSRLVEVVRSRIAADPHTWIEARCSPYHENSAFHPVFQTLARALGVEENAPEDARRAGFESGLRDAGLPATHVAPLMELLSEPSGRDAEGTEGAAHDRRTRTLDAFGAWLLRLAAERPVVVLVEDIHWIDPSTLELLGHLIGRVTGERVLQIFTFRPEFEVPWDSGPRLLKIGLHPLTGDQIRVLCTSLAGGRTLPPTVLDELAHRADGVPLFAEELTRAVLEVDWLPDRGLPQTLAIPSTLQESLMARLDRLGPTKELAQLCGVLGREVSYDLLRAVSPMRERDLQAGLRRLVEADLLSREGPAHQPLYVFRHALIQETAYHSLLRSERAGFHARIARVLEEQFAERIAGAPEDLAHHYERAGSMDHAVRCYGRAAKRAVDRSAHAEAIGHLDRAIALVGGLPENVERDRRELELQVALGTSTMIAKGQGHPQVEAAHARARDLSRRTGDRAELFRALWGLSRFHQSQGDPQGSHELALQLLELAEKADDPSLARWAHLALGQALFWRGEPAGALRELEATIALCSDAENDPDVAIFGQNPTLTSRSLVGPALWMLGQPDEALRRSRDCLELARKVADPFSIAMALDWAAVVHQMRGERESTRELASEAISLSHERGFPLYRGFGRVMRGWAMTETPADAGGLAEIERGLDDLQAAGTGLGGPYVLALLAEAHANLGRTEDGLLTAESALAIAGRQQSRLWDAELLRLKGEMVTRLGHAADGEGERLLRQSLETARRQHARSLELRAAVSLTRLLVGRDGADAAAAHVRELYGEFGEGFETRDLVAARELLSAQP